MNFICININWIVLIVGIFTTVGITAYYHHTKSRQLLNYIPTVWTSLGILGTFVTIVHVLGDGTIAWTDINELVMRISPAFETSIIGIICAIITSIAAKVIYAKEDKDEVDEYSMKFKVSPEQLIGLLYKEATTINKRFDAINSSHSKILNQMQNILTASGKHHQALIEESKAQRSLAERMIQDFTKNLKEFYNTMYEEEKLHMQELTEQYLGGINQIIMSTHGTIKAKFEALFTEHADALKNIMDQEGVNFDDLCKKITTQLNDDSKIIIDSVTNTGLAQTKAVGQLVSDTKDSIRQVADETKQVIAQMSDENKNALDSISATTQRDISTVTNEFANLLKTLKTQFEELAKNLPEELKSAKGYLIETLNNLTETRYNELSAENKKLVAQLLRQVEEYQKNITTLAAQSQSQWISAINAELTKLLKKVDDDVQTNTQLLSNTTNDINKNLTTISDTLDTSTKDYSSLTGQLTTLVTALQKETDATEAYVNSISSTNTQLTAIQKLISDVVNKNLQLRQELSQWRRTHKHVKVDVEREVKECPNCHEENPIDASFCRKCATSFWQCEPISK